VARSAAAAAVGFEFREKGFVWSLLLKTEESSALLPSYVIIP